MNSGHVENLEWAAVQLDISMTTAYRLAQRAELPGAFKVGGLWRISVPKFLQSIHGEES